MKLNARGVRALTFDVFGTVVDWRGSIIREGAVWGREHKLDVDWAKFADRWRAGYRPALERVRRGELPWRKLDDIHRSLLDELIEEFTITGLTEAEKDRWNRVWHRLDPWPDAAQGLARLKKHLVIATLSNGNVSLLVDLAKHAGLPWDAVFSSELFGRYKPDRENYLGAAALLGCQPEEVMMVAAHPGDLRAAHDCGFQTALVARPMEHGAAKKAGAAASLGADPSAPAYNIRANDFLDLAEQLEAGR